MQVLFWFAAFFTVLGYFFNWLFGVIDKRWFNPFADKLIDDVRKAELGDEGENGVCYELERLLDTGAYKVHRNFKIPGKKYDFDAVVVGPKGVIVFEIKNRVNPTLFANTVAYEEKGGNMITIPYRDDPRRKLNNYCRDLEKFFSDQGLGKLAINRAVVFLKNESARIIGDKINVWVICGLRDIGKYLEEIKIDPRFTPAFCETVNRVLSK